MGSRRRYTKEFKEEAIRMVESGVPVRQLASDLDVSEWTIRSWLKELRGTSASGQPVKKLTMEEENRRLREENRRLRLEREILKKATAFFAKGDR